MRLVGILSQSLGGFTCVRGFAPLGDLERASFADMSFQRNLITEQREAIVRFLSNRQYLFFPEIILSYNLKYDFALQGAVSGLNPLRNILDRKSFKSNVDPISFRSTKGILQQVTIDIPEKYLKDHKPFFRIDGNHRLSAVPEGAAFNNYNTPFCLILFEDTKEAEAYKRVIFHNINSKSIPLTSEENLRLILDDIDIFPDQVLIDEPFFGQHFLFARKLKDEVNLEVLTSIANSFKYEKENGEEISIKRTTLLKLFELLLQKEVITNLNLEINRVHSAVVSVNSIYQHFQQLRENQCYALFISFVYYELNTKIGDFREAFRSWVLSNHIYEIEEIEPLNFINVFDKILTARRRHIFVSMQFTEDTKTHHTAIQEAIDEVNRRHKLELKLKEIRIDELNKGYSYTISDEILELINNTGLLIADLTHSNKNVYHELGFLMGLNSGRGLHHENFILLIKNKTDGTTDKEIGFNIRDYQQIRFDSDLILKNRLIESLEVYYKLKTSDIE